MIELGISLYPEQESFQEIENYIKVSSTYGFTKIFTSLFSVPGEKEEVSAYFKMLCDVAHANKMEVCADVNAMMFEKFGASENDLSVFKEIGIDELRMDFCFFDERDVTLVQNKENIKIQFSAFMKDVMTAIVDKVNDIEITACHNFYPERYTGVPKKDFNRINTFWEDYENVKVGAFISSNVDGAHGPWPVSDGLPTIEDHRGRSIDFQIREMMAMGNVDVIYFGNAFASEEELKEAQAATIPAPESKDASEMSKAMEGLMPNIGKKRVTFKIDAEKDLNEVEKKILFEFDRHCELGDTSDYMLRSRITRMIYGKESIPHRPCAQKYFTKGDILIVNDNLKHYCGELEICMKDMENDGQRNLAGRLNDDEIELINLIEAGTFFNFK